MVPLLPFGPYTGEAYSQTNRFFSSAKHSNAVCAAPTRTSLCSGELQGSCSATPHATTVKRAIFGTALATSSSCLSLEIAQNLHKPGAPKSEYFVPSTSDLRPPPPPSFKLCCDLLPSFCPEPCCDQSSFCFIHSVGYGFNIRSDRILSNDVTTSDRRGMRVLESG